MDKLSKREKEVLRFISLWLTTAEIAKKLHLSFKTIESHKEHIKTKLGLENWRELIQFALREAH